MKRALIACAAMAVLLAGAFAQGPKTPADWVTQLGADRLQDRDAASAALLSLGVKARDAVHDALDSKDPEIKSRANDLWKTLRWLVVPDAAEDTKKLVDEAEKGSIDEAHWQAFVQKHGGESIRLVAEFRAKVLSEGNAAPQIDGGGNDQVIEMPVPTARQQDDIRRNNIYMPGLRAVLDNAPPIEVGRAIAETDPSNGRASLEALLDELPPVNTPEKTAYQWMQVEIALWNYEKAYAFGRDFALHATSHQVVRLCAVAADRGGMTDKIPETAKKEIAAETDPNQLCVKLSFYTGLFTDLDKKAFIDPLFETAREGLTTKASDASLRRLVETLLSAQMPLRAVKALHNVQSAEALYMRSAADLQMQNEPVAGADWVDAMNALDALDDARKKQSFYELGDLMHEWHDDRAVVLWQKILALKPADTVYDANACFRMGEFLETQRQWGNAAAFYERGMTIASKITNGIMIATTSNGNTTGSGKQTVLDKIRELKSRAAGEKSIFDNNTPAPDGGTDDPQ